MASNVVHSLVSQYQDLNWKAIHVFCAINQFIKMEVNVFRRAENPFEVPHLRRKILSHMGYGDLCNYQVVSKECNEDASKEIAKLKDAVSKVQVQFHLIPTDQATLLAALQEQTPLFRIENGDELLDFIRSRSLGSSRHDTLPPIKCDKPICPQDLLYLLALHRFRFTSLHACYDRKIQQFWTKPEVGQLVVSVEFGHAFVDIHSILAILTQLPQLKEVKLKIDVRMCLENVFGEDALNGWEIHMDTIFPLPDSEHSGEYSSVQKLQVELMCGALGTRNVLATVLKFCSKLKSVRVITWSTKPLMINFLMESIRNRELIECLELHSIESATRTNLELENVGLTSTFCNLKCLDLFSWGRISLTDWTLLSTTYWFSPSLVCLRLHHSECPQKLIWSNVENFGFNRSNTLKHLMLSSTWQEQGEQPSWNCYRDWSQHDWYEEWNAVEVGEAKELQLTEARVIYDGTSVVDLKSFEYLTNLTLRVRKSTLATALAFAPATVRNLMITAAAKNFVLALKDSELKAAVVENFAGARDLKEVQVRQRCGYTQCLKWIVKQLFFDELKKTRCVKARELKIVGSGAGKRLIQDVTDEEIEENQCCQHWVQSTNYVV